MTETELKQIRLELQASIDQFLNTTGDLIEAINKHFDRIYGEHDE